MYLLFFNTITKVKQKVMEFGGPEGWKIVPCAPNPSGCKTVVFRRDEIQDHSIDELCALYGLRVLDEDTAPSEIGDMSFLIKRDDSELNNISMIPKNINSIVYD